MAGLIISGHIAAFVLLFTLAELVGFASLRRIWGLGPGLTKLLPGIAAGDFLCLAWLTSGAHWVWAAAALAGALVAHGFDIVSRLKMPRAELR